MFETNLNVRVDEEVLEQFENTCRKASANKSTVVRMLIDVANRSGLAYDPQTGNIKLKGVRRNA